jgi:hypothetical protein
MTVRAQSLQRDRCPIETFPSGTVVHHGEVARMQLPTVEAPFAAERA